MQLSSVLLTLSAAAGAWATNAFSAPSGNETLYAGETFIVRWVDTNGGETIDLLLKKGDADNLQTALTIATDLQNQGAVRWFLPADLETGSDYALQATNKNNDTDVSYSPFFTIVGRNSTSSSASGSGAASTAANSTSGAAPTVVPTNGSSNSSSAITTAANSTAIITSGGSSGNGTATATGSGAGNSTATATNGTTLATSTGTRSGSASGSASGSGSESGSASASGSSGSSESGSSGSASGSASGSGSDSSNGGAAVSYSSLMLAGGLAGAIALIL